MTAITGAAIRSFSGSRLGRFCSTRRIHTYTVSLSSTIFCSDSQLTLRDWKGVNSQATVLAKVEGREIVDREKFTWPMHFFLGYEFACAVADCCIVGFTATQCPYHHLVHRDSGGRQLRSSAVIRFPLPVGWERRLSPTMVPRHLGSP
jgi:hypothetical protein